MIKSGVKTILKKFGYRLSRDSEQPPCCGLSNFFPLIKKFGFDPKHIMDVGANRGNWTRQAVQYFPRARYTLVEPQDHLKAHIQDLCDGGFHVQWINAGASDQAGVLPLYVADKDHSSTFLRSPRTENESIQKIEVPVRTLNEIVASSGQPIPEMVKIDAEGLDLKVLAGASELTGKTEIFLAEATMGERDFENSALALIKAMDHAGYRPIDITDMNRSPKHGILWLCEFVFLRKSSTLLDAADRY
jgi:FkbM family methyltransferase